MKTKQEKVKQEPHTGVSSCMQEKKRKKHVLLRQYAKFYQKQQIIVKKAILKVE